MAHVLMSVYSEIPDETEHMGRIFQFSTTGAFSEMVKECTGTAVLDLQQRDVSAKAEMVSCGFA